MINGLIEKLRNCSEKERRNIALELAKRGDDEVVAELIYMAEGKKKGNNSRWYDVFKKSNHNLNDQLIGVEALGETGNKWALDYLRRVATPNEETLPCRINCDVTTHSIKSECLLVDYHNANGELRDKLRYEAQVYYNRKEKPERTEIRKNEEVHNVLNSAIKKLEEKLNKKH